MYTDSLKINLYLTFQCGMCRLNKPKTATMYLGRSQKIQIRVYCEDKFRVSRDKQDATLSYNNHSLPTVNISTILLFNCDTPSKCSVLTGYELYTENYRHSAGCAANFPSFTCNINQSAHLSLHPHESQIRSISQYTGAKGLSSPSEFAVSIFNLQTRVQTN